MSQSLANFWEETNENARHTNLLTTLSRKAIPDNMIRNQCNNPRCRYCPLLDKSGQIICHVTGRSYKAKKLYTCKSSNLVYCITCKTCGMQYVGQTKRKLMECFQGHFDKIQRKVTQDAVGGHFSQPSHRGTTDMKLHVLDFVTAHPHSVRGLQLRLQKEKSWIHCLRCPAPTGLNIYD